MMGPLHIRRVTAAVLLCGLYTVVQPTDLAKASPSGWLAASPPSLTRVDEAPANQPPPADNFDCYQTSARQPDEPISHSDCVVTTALGQYSAANQAMQFNGSGYQLPIVPPSPYLNLVPVPNQAIFLTYSSAPVVGLYVHVYRTIYDKLHFEADASGAHPRYRIDAAPDFTLRDDHGQPLVVNPASMAFSAHGDWLLFDSLWDGFVRFNTSSFDSQAFAPSLQQTSEYANHTAQLSISNDGRYVAFSPTDELHLYLYDLASCPFARLPVDPLNRPCAVRDYWDAVSNVVDDLRGVSRLRFETSQQLSFFATSKSNGAQTYRVALYRLTAPGAPPSGISYMGMGDSFASGQGAFNYLLGTDTANNGCHLSLKSYPLLLTNQLFAGGHSVACSGATSEDIISVSSNYNGQVKDRLRRNDRDIEHIVTSFQPGYLAQREFSDHYDPSVITVSIGGNDIGFADIVKSCVSPVTVHDTCFSSYEDQHEVMQLIQSKFSVLIQTYSALKAAGRRVYVVSYPQIAAEGGDCALNVHLDASEIRFARQMIDYLNSTIAQASRLVGVQYVDVSQALAGYRLCEANSDEVAVNGLTLGNDSGVGGIRIIGSESYHPNARGQALLNQVIIRATDGLTTTMPIPDKTAVAPPLPLGEGLPRQNRSLQTLTYAAGLAPDIAVSGTSIQLVTKAETVLLLANTFYDAVLHSSPVNLGIIRSTANGTVNGQVVIPADMPVGYHMLHVYGLDMAHRQVDIFKPIYIAAAQDATDDRSNGALTGYPPTVSLGPSAITFASATSHTVLQSAVSSMKVATLPLSRGKRMIPTPHLSVPRLVVHGIQVHARWLQLLLVCLLAAISLRVAGKKFKRRQ